MYLSRVLLDINSPSVRQSLRNCQDMHKTIMRAFDCSRTEASVLYRVFRTEQSIYLYAQSMALPQWDRIEKNGFHCEKIQDISALEEALQENTILCFSLLACPAKKVKSEGKNSKRVLLRGEKERLEWLKRQGEKYGFSLLEAHEVAKEEKLSGTKPSGEFFVVGVPFEGVLQISDPALFQEGFKNGIGAEKAYGLGMLMLSRYQP